MVNIIGNKSSIFNQFVRELRDVEIQKDSLRFRRNVERIGEILAYEISQTLEYTASEVQTPLGVANTPQLTDKVVLATILRAGIALQNGMLNYFDRAESAFVSAYRKYHKDGTFEVKFKYSAAPPLDDKVLILSDPMLATGASMVLSYNALVENGAPKHTHIVAIIASREGVEYVKRHLPLDKVTLWVGAVDDEMTVKSYIVPGLGDAGDLAYGEKE